MCLQELIDKIFHRIIKKTAQVGDLRQKGVTL